MEIWDFQKLNLTLLGVISFFKKGHSQPIFYFCLFYLITIGRLNFADVGIWSLVMEAIALPTEPPPLPFLCVISYWDSDMDLPASTKLQIIIMLTYKTDTLNPGVNNYFCSYIKGLMRKLI